MIFTAISFLFPAHGFGLNTNIFETNLINLSVVIAVVVSFVGDAVKELLKNRKETIINNLREADIRAAEAQEKLNQAKELFVAAQKKAADIREQGVLSAELEKKLCIQQAEEDALRLQDVKQDTIRLEQQKAIQQLTQQIVGLALTKVRKKLKTNKTPFHVAVNNLKIALFSKSLGTAPTPKKA